MRPDVLRFDRSLRDDLRRLNKPSSPAFSIAAEGPRPGHATTQTTAPPGTQKAALSITRDGLRPAPPYQRPQVHENAKPLTGTGNLDREPVPARSCRATQPAQALPCRSRRWAGRDLTD